MEGVFRIIQSVPSKKAIDYIKSPEELPLD
jgi:hypothetical protein